MARYTRLKWACYMSNVCMSIVSAFVPLLFVGFHEMYDISYTALGSLVLINFVTQLLVDLIYSIFPKKLNTKISVRLMPIITLIGLVFLALVPEMFGTHIYLGIVIGVIIISASSGIAEVLISRVIAAIPSESPEREMSALHSVFAFGVVGTVIVSTIFLELFTYKYWQVLAGVLAVVPLVAACLYIGQPFPYIMDDEGKGSRKPLASWGFVLAVMCIFLGAASENVMSQWVSSYVETALGIPKIWGDLLGVAMFSLFLGLGRYLYSRIGRRITIVLIIGATLTFACYLMAALVPSPYVAMAACALSGFTTSMLWPGTIIAASPRYECAGVAMFALLAAGGDLGGSIAPQIMGSLTDTFMLNETCLEYATSHGITIEVVAMRTALLAVAIFPLLLIVVASIFHHVLARNDRDISMLIENDTDIEHDQDVL